jgi:cobalt-zinc-cadmium efflux system outer membrane protein
MFSRVGAADAELRAARRRATVATVALAARARASFYRAAAAAQRVELRRLIAEAARASAEFAKSLHDAGNITDLDRTREVVFEAEANIALDEAHSASSTMREALNAVLGLHGSETNWRVASDLPAPPDHLAPLSALEREAVAASLELEAMRWDLQAAGKAVGLARLQSVLPSLGVGVAAKREGEGEWSLGPAVSLSLPLFNWGQARRSAAWARLHGLQHRYAATGINVRAAARAASARIVSAHERVMRMRTVVMPQREKLLEQATRQYNAMNLDAFELLSMRREQVEAEARYIDTLQDYWLAHNEVEQLRAGSLPGTDSESASGGEVERQGASSSQGEEHE